MFQPLNKEKRINLVEFTNQYVHLDSIDVASPKNKLNSNIGDIIPQYVYHKNMGYSMVLFVWSVSILFKKF